MAGPEIEERCRDGVEEVDDRTEDSDDVGEGLGQLQLPGEGDDLGQHGEHSPMAAASSSKLPIVSGVMRIA